MRPSFSLRSAVVTTALALAACGGSAGSVPAPATEGCTTCHGDASRPGTSTEQAAPPVDAHGGSSTTLVTVGAHQAHLQNGVACSTCHTVPPDGDRTHIDGPYAQVTFTGPLVGANNTLVAPWNRDVATCANYCHGASFVGGATPNPSWTFQGSFGCGDCHGDQQTATTQSGLHYFHVKLLIPSFTCANCHGDGYAPTSVTPPATTTHHDGQVNLLPLVGWQASACAAEGPHSCNGSCHTLAPGCKVWQ
jgi:hypothetical protein